MRILEQLSRNFVSSVVFRNSSTCTETHEVFFTGRWKSCFAVEAAIESDSLYKAYTELSSSSQ